MMQPTLTPLEELAMYAKKPLQDAFSDQETPVPYDPVLEVRRHMHNMTPDDWCRMAYQMRQGQIFRIFSDEQLMALLQLWLATSREQDQSSSPGQSPQAA